jgi:hypothetical protein
VLANWENMNQNALKKVGGIMSANRRLPASIADHRQLKILLLGNVYLCAIGALGFFGQNVLDSR